MSHAIAEVAARLVGASSVTVLTGAGVSAASGVPTFRGAAGLWRNFSPQRLATAEAFAEHPRLVWEWYDWRRQLIAACRPNHAHEVLAGWSRRLAGFTLVTQNVDGLHERARTRNVIRFHGSIWEMGCWDACPASPPRWVDESVPLAEVPPRCPFCGGLARPGVVWFGEAIPPVVLQQTAAALRCGVFMAIGTSSQVYPAAGLVHEARAAGAFSVEVNPEATPASGGVDLALKGTAEEILVRLDAALNEAARVRPGPGKVR